MTTWLHFIGRIHYDTPKTFIEEARQVGVSRRVSLQQAKAMRYGDVVVLAQWHPKRQAAYVFGQYEIVSVYGHGLAALLREDEGKMIAEPFRVARGCGEFAVSMTRLTVLDIPELLARVDAQHPVSALMVGGSFLRIQPYYLKDIRHRQGFRSLNATELEAAVQEGFARAACPVIRGQFYVWGPLLSQDEQAEVDGLIYEVEQYRKRP